MTRMQSERLRPGAALPLAVALLLGACTAGTAYRPPDPPVPPAWTQANERPREANGEWWRSFGDPVLDELVAAALTANLDIDAALSRIDQASAAASVERATALPAADASGSLGRARQSIEHGQGRLGRYLPGNSRTQNEATLGLSVNWDIDFAGGLRRRQESALGAVDAARARADAARLAVIAETVDAYLGYRQAEARLAILTSRREAIADRQGIMMARLRLGETSQSSFAQSNAVVAQVEAALSPQRAMLAAGRHRLAILLGRPAGTPLPMLDLPAPIPLAADPAAGAPGDILRYRPDIVAAEADLRASHAEIGAALAEYWPKISLGGLIGFSSNTLSRFGTEGSNVVQGGVGLRWRLFDFGRIDAEVAMARGKEREALSRYRKTVLEAGEQVETAFAELAAWRFALERTYTQRDELAKAEASARAAYLRGQTSRDELRAAELGRLEVEDAAIAARAALAKTILSCHRALGSQ